MNQPSTTWSGHLPGEAPCWAICNETYGDWPLERALADMAKAGYHGVEFAPFTLCDDPALMTVEEAQGIGRQTAEHGLQVAGLHWLLAQTPTASQKAQDVSRLHLTDPQAPIRAYTVKHAQHLARLCHAMAQGAQEAGVPCSRPPVMVWGSPHQRSFPESQTREQAFDLAVQACREVAQVCGDLGVVIAFEPLGPNETNFIVSAQEGVELIEAVDHQAFQLHLDVKAMANQPQDGSSLDGPIVGPDGQAIGQIIREHAKHLVHFHANDPNLRGPGQGEVAFEPIAQALADISYTGWVSVEVFDYTPDAQTVVRESMDCLRRVFTAKVP